MLNIGVLELLIIFLVGIIFLSPKDLVHIIKGIKQLRHKIKALYTSTQEYLQDVTGLEEDIPQLWHKDLPKPNEYIHKMFNCEFLPTEQAKESLARANKQERRPLDASSLPEIKSIKK